MAGKIFSKSEVAPVEGWGSYFWSYLHWVPPIQYVTEVRSTHDEKGLTKFFLQLTNEKIELSTTIKLYDLEVILEDLRKSREEKRSSRNYTELDVTYDSSRNCLVLFLENKLLVRKPGVKKNLIFLYVNSALISALDDYLTLRKNHSDYTYGT